MGYVASIMPTMQVQHHSEWEGRRLTVTWLSPPFLPPRDATTQAMGLCFTADHRVVLVTSDGASWTLPGGSLEQGETPVQALKREVREEACAVVRRSVYLGCQRVDDPGHPQGLTHYYQTRFWARVTLRPFERAFETVARRLVEPEHVLEELAWGHVPIARVLLELALAAADGS